MCVVRKGCFIPQGDDNKLNSLLSPKHSKYDFNFNYFTYYCY